MAVADVVVDVVGSVNVSSFVVAIAIAVAVSPVLSVDDAVVAALTPAAESFESDFCTFVDVLDKDEEGDGHAPLELVAAAVIFLLVIVIVVVAAVAVDIVVAAVVAIVVVVVVAAVADVPVIFAEGTVVDEGQEVEGDEGNAFTSVNGSSLIIVTAATVMSSNPR